MDEKKVEEFSMCAHKRLLHVNGCIRLSSTARYCFEIKIRLNFEFFFPLSEKRINQKVYSDIGLSHPSLGPSPLPSCTYITIPTYIPAFSVINFSRFLHVLASNGKYIYAYIFVLLHTSDFLFMYTVKRCRNKNVLPKAVFAGPPYIVCRSSWVFSENIMRRSPLPLLQGFFFSFFVCVLYAWDFFL